MKVLIDYEKARVVEFESIDEMKQAGYAEADYQIEITKAKAVRDKNKIKGFL